MRREGGSQRDEELKTKKDNWIYKDVKTQGETILGKEETHKWEGQGATLHNV